MIIIVVHPGLHPKRLALCIVSPAQGSDGMTGPDLPDFNHLRVRGDYAVPQLGYPITPRILMPA